jgi:hypothetical protein
MDELRPEIQEAFAEQQSKLGNLADSRERLVRGALAARAVHREGRMHFAAGVAALVIAALVIATFAYVRNGVGATRHGPPVPASSPTPLSRPLNVSNDTPVILYHDPAKFDQLDGMTWDGKVSGRVGDGVAHGGIGNPRGSQYATLTDIRDRVGHVLVDYSPKDQTIYWADDSSHYCTIVRTASRDVSGVGELELAMAGSAPQQVARVGMFSPATSNGGGPAVVACSPAADRAIVSQSGGQGVGVTQFWVLQLSSGRVLWTGGPGTWIAASHDGRFVALSGISGDATIFGETGAPLAHLATTVFGFSWDATLVVAGQNFSSPASVVRWRDGTTVWAGPGGAGSSNWQSFAEPSGSHMAIGILDLAAPHSGGWIAVNLYVISAGGALVFERKDLVLLLQ